MNTKRTATIQLMLTAAFFFTGLNVIRAADMISIAGTWRFAADQNDAGIGQQWFDRSLTNTFRLPGSLPAAGIGDPITTNTVWTGSILDRSWFTSPRFAKYRQPGNVKVPFWLQPNTYYNGVTWFQRDIEVPANWSGKRASLFLERPHWETQVWLDGRFIGSDDSLSTPHQYDLGQLVPGKHTLTIRVDNRRIVDIGENSHAITDHTQGNWNGIIGNIELRATPLVRIDGLQVYPNVTNKSVTLKGTLKNDSGQAGAGELNLQIQPVNFSTNQKIVAQKNLTISWNTNGGSFETELNLGAAARLWDEFNPNLYELTATIAAGNCKQTTFGLRQISTQGRQFTVNGRKTFLRGLVEEDDQQSPFLTCQAVNFIRDHKQKEGTDGNPFFLFVSYVDTHSPHNQAPEELVRRYESATFRDVSQEKSAACHIQAVEKASENPEVERRKMMEYYAAASFVDQQVGEVLAELQSSGLMENTLVVYTNDHGLNCGQHGIWEKGASTLPQNFLEESVGVACTVSWPAGGIRQNATCDDLVNHCDLSAMLLEVAGATPDAPTAAQINSPGISYLKQLRGQSVPSWRQTIFSEYGNTRMARTDRYKLINRYPYADVRFPDELYDLREDPRETVNRHDDPTLKQVVSDLSAELDVFFAKHTIPGHDGLDLANQPVFAGNSSWIKAEKEYGVTVNAYHTENSGSLNSVEPSPENSKEN